MAGALIEAVGENADESPAALSLSGWSSVCRRCLCMPQENGTSRNVSLLIRDIDFPEKCHFPIYFCVNPPI